MDSNRSFPLWILLSLILILFLESANLTNARQCLEDCGGVEIIYPFGVGEGCYMEKWYEIVCNASTSGKQVPFLSVINKEVVNISLPAQFKEYLSSDDPSPYGSVLIKNQITSKGCSSDGEELGSLLNLTGTPFYVSQKNTLTAVGCNNTASLTNVEPSIVGCQSSCGTKDHTPTKYYLAQATCYNRYGYDAYLCDETTIMEETSCNGNKCCKAVMPDRVQQIVGVRIDDNTTTGGCKVAFLSEKAFSPSNVSDPKRLHAKGYSTVEIGWFIHTKNLSKVTSLECYDIKDYLNPFLYSQRKAFLSNARCVCDYNTTLSYARCSCNKGYEGNPYLLNGCRG